MRKRAIVVGVATALLLGACGSNSNDDRGSSDSANGRNQPAAQAPTVPAASPSPTALTYTPAATYVLKLTDYKGLNFKADVILEIAKPIPAKGDPRFVNHECKVGVTDLVIPFKFTLANRASTPRQLQLSMYVAYSKAAAAGRSMYAWSNFGAGRTNCGEVKPISEPTINPSNLGISTRNPVATNESVSFTGFYAIRDYYDGSGNPATAMLASLNAAFYNMYQSPSEDEPGLYYTEGVAKGGVYGRIQYLENAAAGTSGEKYFVPLDGTSSPCTTLKIDTGLPMKCGKV